MRYSDGDAHGWAERVRAFDDPRVGAAIHSVRAVPRDQLPVVVEAARGLPLHVHVSEQVAENEACLAAHGLTPTQLLAEAGALGPLTTAVHATHLTDEDIRLLGGSRAPTSASARPPSATSPTGSGRRGACTRPAPPSRWARTVTR